VHQAIQTRFEVVNLPTAGTRWDQQRDGEVGAEALQVRRERVGVWTGRISNLNGSGCLASGRGGFVGSLSTAQRVMVSPLYILIFVSNRGFRWWHISLLLDSGLSRL